MRRPVLIVDDDEALRALLRLTLEDKGYRTCVAGTAARGLELHASEAPIAVVLDLGLPDRPGREVLAEMLERAPETPVVILTAQDDVRSIVDCMRAGATDFVSKPFDRTRLTATVQNAVERDRLTRENATLKRELRQTRGFEQILGGAPPLLEAIGLLRRAAQSDVTLLIEGESGTGKEVAARAVHAECSRGGGPFVAINCGAIPDNLIESELFGHEKGAFTGAAGKRKGRFEEAEGGTLFLDEIGELRPNAQVRLLRVLQERQITRLGGNDTIDVDVRIIGATHRDLRGMVAAGDFREDLYYRLAVFPVNLPPLRVRGDDVIVLATHLLHKQGQDQGRSLRGFTEPARQALLEHDWPGNVRELVNIVQRATILCDADEVRLEHLPTELVAAAFPSGAPPEPSPSSPAGSPSAPLPASDARPAVSPPQWSPGEQVEPFEAVERKVLQHALEQFDWNVTAAANALEIGRATLYRKIERFGLEKSVSD